MELKSDLETEVESIFNTLWTERDGTTVPDDDDLQLGNDAVHIKATVLYADMRDSTKLVDSHQWWFASEIYKSFLRCAARIIRDEGGVISAYDGDRVMSVFIGDSKNSTATRCALKINWAVKNIVQPAMEKQYPDTKYTLNHVVGIDTSNISVARIGIRGSNDLVWVSRAANYAAKLSALEGYPTWITKTVYDNLNKKSKYAGTTQEDMWVADTWNGNRVYRSTYWWPLS
jgi:class 3 adenylate cyclase